MTIIIIQYNVIIMTLIINKKMDLIFKLKNILGKHADIRDVFISKN